MILYGKFLNSGFLRNIAEKVGMYCNLNEYMKIRMCLRSRSFFDPGPRSHRFCCPSVFLNISSETTGPIRVKFHVDPSWDGRTKVDANDLGDMTKTAAMHIYIW